MKIRPVGAEFFYANRQTDRHYKPNDLLFINFAKRLKTEHQTFSAFGRNSPDCE